MCEVIDFVPPKPVPLAPHFVLGLVPYRGEIVPVLSLASLLGITATPAAREVLVLLCSEQHEIFAVSADTLDGITQPPQDSWRANPANLDPLSTRFFDGFWQQAHGVIIQLNPSELNPKRLMANEWLGRGPAPRSSEVSC